MAGHALIGAQVRGKMVTWFDWGEYTLWHLGGGLRVSMDGRRETIYSDTVLERHFALYEGTPEGLAYLQRLDPDYVWLRHRRHVPGIGSPRTVTVWMSALRSRSSRFVAEGGCVRASPRTTFQ